MRPQAALRWGLALVVPVGLGLLLFWNESLPRRSHTVVPEELGTLQRHSGGSQGFASLHGRVRVINFWATWCHPCVAEIPELVAAMAELEPRGVVLLAVNSDGGEDARPLVDEFLLAHGSAWGRYVVYGDPPFLGQYPVRVLPTTYVVDGEGRVVQRFEGAIDRAALRRAVERALSGTHS